MAEERITKKTLKHHWTYSWWKYLLLTVMCAVLVDLAFTTTAYRAPEEKKIELYVLNGYCDTEAMKRDIEPQFFAAYPEQEELIIMNVNLNGGDIYAAMQFSTYMAAQQGDVVMIPVSEAKKLADEGADQVFMELTPYLESGAIDAQGIDLTAGTMACSTGETGIFGIPADTLYGMEAYGTNMENSLLCVLAYNGNEDTAASMVSLLIAAYHTEKPQAVEVMEEPKAPMVLF